MRDKWNVKKNKKGYLKIHVAVVNIKTKKILPMKVTDDEHVHDSKALPELIENIIKSNNMIAMDKLFAVSAYDSNNIFKFLTYNGILHSIKVRKKSQM